MTEPIRAHEVDIARDMARKSVVVASVLVLASSLIWGIPGALSSLYAVVLVVLNLLASAALIAYAAPRGANHLMAAVMGGYIVRLGVLTVAIFAVKDASWVERAPLFITLLVTHLGLLFWETRSVSLSLAYPGLKPKETPAR
jgi:F0F1-type ATP synthase assembly protein I